MLPVHHGTFHHNNMKMSLSILTGLTRGFILRIIKIDFSLNSLCEEQKTVRCMSYASFIEGTGRELF